MSHSTATLEGRLMAQRKLLARLIAALQTGRGADDVVAFLEEHVQFQAHEEDPGAVPSEELSIEFAIYDEMRLILDASRRYAAETGD